MKKLLLILFLASLAGAAQRNLADAEFVTCSTAVALYTGDTINIPADTATWTKGITLDRAITLRGSGKNTTRIIAGTAGQWLLGIQAAVPADNPYISVSGIEFDGDSLGLAITIRNSSSDYPLSHFRVHNNRIRRCPDARLTGGDGAAYYAIRVWGDCFGLIDSNEFYKNYFDIKFYGNQKNSWDKYPGLENIGSENYCYFENNTSSYCYFRVMESGEGARFVWRYNYTDDNYAQSLWDAHGDTRNWGVVAHEIYNNTIRNDRDPVSGAGNGHDMRGGTGLLYNNSMCAGTSGERAINMIREEYFSPDPESADGCWCKINNSYIFNNRNYRDGNTLALWETDDYNCIAENTDWWDDAIHDAGGESPSNFTYDTYANRPASPIVNDCYWATDSMKLYRCETSNVWTFIYKPYTYPHPLASGGGGGETPSNVCDIKIGRK